MQSLGHEPGAQRLLRFSGSLSILLYAEEIISLLSDFPCLAMEVLPASLCRAVHSGPESVSLTRNVPLTSKEQDQALCVCIKSI